MRIITELVAMKSKGYFKHMIRRNQMEQATSDYSIAFSLSQPDSFI